jgi:large subunit ribosomal protein L1
MAGNGRRYQESLAQVDRDREYGLDEALEVLKGFRSARFDETVELSVQLGIDPRQSDQRVRDSIVLPSGIGKTQRVIVFAEGEAAEQAQEAGADRVSGEDLAKQIEEGWMDFDVALATPGMMRVIGRLGRILGPRGLMPSPKNGTVREDVAEAVQEFKAGKVELRNDSGGNVHAPVGKLSFSAEALKDNVEAVLDYLRRSRPLTAKGRYFRKVVLSSTMSPGIKVKASG